jgi:hypothetical protein
MADIFEPYARPAACWVSAGVGSTFR